MMRSEGGPDAGQEVTKDIKYSSSVASVENRQDMMVRGGGLQKMVLSLTQHTYLVFLVHNKRW